MVGTIDGDAQQESISKREWRCLWRELGEELDEDDSVTGHTSRQVSPIALTFLNKNR